MKGRLWLLNLLLLAGVVMAATTLRNRWIEARAKESLLVNRRISPGPPPTVLPMPAVGASSPTSYIDVAQKMVFVKDRNPNIILDPPPPPPPPKPMPQLPVAYGVIDLGTGPTAILSERAGAQHKGYRAGDQIGEFKLVALNNRELVFEWEGKQVRKTLEELKDRRPVSEAKPAEETAAAPKPASTTLAPAKPGPGEQVSETTRACVTGDPSPSGTVIDGMKKVVVKTPFGEQCRWEAAK